MNTNGEVAAVLRKAAEVQRERGHCKGGFRDYAGRMCLWGSINEAIKADSSMATVRDHPLYLPIRYVIELKVLALGEPRTLSAWPGADWNDKPETTGPDVEKFLLQLADEVEVQ